MIQNEEDSYDITQETFLKFMKYGTSYQRNNLKGYLLTIARNLCFDYQQRKKEAGKNLRTGRSQHNGAAGIFQAHGRQKVHYQGENNDFRDLLQKLLAGGFDHLANREEISPKASGHRHERQTGSQNLQR